MPSVQQDLGKYVTVRPRRDGTYRVLFEVPARIRPSGWPSTRPLPIDGRRGDLTDAAEVARIQADARRLYAALEACRAGTTTPETLPRNFSTLIAAWKASRAWKDNKPRTNKGYDEVLREVLAWETANNPDPTDLKVPDIEAFLAIFDDRPTQRYHVHKVLRIVMDQAINLDWRQDNPARRVKLSMPKTRVTIWEQDDVDTYAWAALAAGNPDMAAIILTQWEIGQRTTDLTLFRRGIEYLPREGVFSFEQSKTAQRVVIPISDRLRAILDLIERPDSIYLFHNNRRSTADDVLELILEGQAAGKIPSALKMGRALGLSDNAIHKARHKLEARGLLTTIDGRTVAIPGHTSRSRPFKDDQELSDVFGEIRRRFVIPAGGRYLRLRVLRHSCVVQLKRGGAEVSEICAVTGHSLASAHEILEVYSTRDSKVAENAQRKRGLIA